MSISYFFAGHIIDLNFNIARCRDGDLYEHLIATNRVWIEGDNLTGTANAGRPGTVLEYEYLSLCSFASLV